MTGLAPHQPLGTSKHKDTLRAAAGSDGGSRSPCTNTRQVETGEGPKRQVPLSRSRGHRRYARLVRGGARWLQDVQLCPERVDRVWAITLTTIDKDPEAAYGRAMTFWRRVRQRFLGARYFCWAELQRRGAVHYHAVWLNPPQIGRTRMYRLIDHLWGPGRTQVRAHDAAWLEQKGMGYLLDYAKKKGGKQYQQDYEQLPTGIRVFMNQQLEIPARVLDDHRDRPLFQHRWGGLGRADEWDEYLELTGRIIHAVPEGGYCSAVHYRRRKRVRGRGSGFRWPSISYEEWPAPKREDFPPGLWELLELDGPHQVAEGTLAATGESLRPGIDVASSPIKEGGV